MKMMVLSNIYRRTNKHITNTMNLKDYSGIEREVRAKQMIDFWGMDYNCRRAIFIIP